MFALIQWLKRRFLAGGENFEGKKWIILKRLLITLISTPLVVHDCLNSWYIKFVVMFFVTFFVWNVLKLADRFYQYHLLISSITAQRLVSCLSFITFIVYILEASDTCSIFFLFLLFSINIQLFTVGGFFSVYVYYKIYG